LTESYRVPIVVFMETTTQKRTTGITSVTVARTIAELRQELGYTPSASQVADRMVPEAPKRRMKAWHRIHAYVEQA
jgi:alpha-D-ribose 1-methylphosphonate 5-triphosphate diphosphatase PhnM